MTVASAAACTAAGVALAAGGWPQAGGDVGRSGNQALSGGPGAMSPIWTRQFAENQPVQSGAIITRPGFAGAPPRLVYGTSDGRVHIHDAYSGAPIGPEDGIQLLASTSTDAFRGFGGALTAVDTTDADGYGQIFVLHNDDNQTDPANRDPNAQFPDDIAIAQIDTQSGKLIRDVSIPDTDGFTVSAPPLLTEANEDGDRFLIFTANKSADWEADSTLPFGDRKDSGLAFSVPLNDARKMNAEIDTGGTQTNPFVIFGAEPILGLLDTTDVINPMVPPALMYLSDESGPAPAPGTKPPVPDPFVVFATGNPETPLQLLTPDLGGTGPVSPRLDADASESRRIYPYAVAVPAAEVPQGVDPGAKDLVPVRSSGLIVTTYDPGSNESTVHRLVPTPDGAGLTIAATSAAIPGRPSPLLATSQLSGETATGAGRVVVGTATSLTGLRGSDMTRIWQLDPSVKRRAGVDGFSRTGATLVGDAAMLTTDDGRPVVVDRDTGKPIAASRFSSVVELSSNKSAVLSPAVGAGIVAFVGDRGLAVYRVACGNRIVGTEKGDTLPGSTTGDDVFGRGGADKLDLRHGDDCADGGEGDDRIDGGDGADVIDAGEGKDLVLGGAGADEIEGGLGNDQLFAGAGDDTVVAGEGDDITKGADGNDDLQGGGGDDVITGGDGDDGLDGGSGSDRLKGNAGNDRLDGGSGRDKLDGGAGNDSLISGPGGGELIGGAGDDIIDAANGRKDIVRCGAGRDQAIIDRFDVRTGCESVTDRTVVLPRSGAKAKTRKRSSASSRARSARFDGAAR